MFFQFTHPGYLLLLPVLLAIGWWAGRRSLANLRGARRVIANIVRVLVLALLVLALAGVQVVHTKFALCTVFVVDASASVSQQNQQAALAYIREACKQMRKDDTAAIVVFGADAYVESPPSPDPKITRIYSVPSPHYTDLAAALRLAMASFSQGAGRQIVVLSDGNENLGTALDQAKMSKAGDVKISTVALRPQIKSETLLERATLPPEVKQGEPFEIKLVATATAPASGQVRLFRNGAYIGSQPVNLPPGKTLLTISQSIAKPGFYTYEALLEAGPDATTENNRAMGFVQVRGKPQVLLLAGWPEQEQHLVKALSEHDINITLKGPEGLPTNLAGWRNWDAVMFADVPATAMAPEQMLMAQNYVRSLGGGFGMLGGEEGFGAGGYFKTPIEETLPVDMSVRKHKVFPSLAVMLIMDTSGSSGMDIDGKTMIKLEAESAIQVVELMNDKDQLGVIVSGEGTNVLAPIRLASNKTAIKRDISRMAPGGGGIYCYPSLELAYREMRKVKARIRHIIMLADGTDCDEQEGCDRLAAQMKRDKITLSTLSFGNGPHTPFLQRIAAIGDGKSYIATKARDLPRIFTKDAMLASKSLLVEERFLPKVDTSAEVLRGIDFSAMPPLLGYVATSAKPLAQVAMETHKDDPLLATWRYGLGRSVAFTSDAHARWAAYWLGWKGYSEFWTQAMRWMLKRGQPTNWQTHVEEKNGVGRITVEALDEQAGFINFLDLEAHIVKPDMKTETVRLEQVAPGRYAHEFPVRDIGAYLVTVTRRGKTDGSGQTAGVVIPYPPEYRDLKANEFLLNQLAETTGGLNDPAPETLYGGKREAARSPQDIWMLLVLLAALLWPIDVAARRLMLDRTHLATATAWAHDRVTGAWDGLRGRLGHPPIPQETLSQLLQSREERRTKVEEQLPRRRQGEIGTAVIVGEPETPSTLLDEHDLLKPTTLPAKEKTPAAEKPDDDTPKDSLARLRSAKQRAKKKD
jgi:uncharacterized membrane protein/secreted protein with Ig-like and vWFA domain